MGGVDKVFADLRGKPVIEWSVDVFERCADVASIVIVLSASSLSYGKELFGKSKVTKVSSIVTGGARRQDSVRAGLDALTGHSPACEMIAIQDGARPFVDDEMVSRGVVAADREGAAVAAVPVKDTVKVAGPDRIVLETLDRSRLWAVQTPQVFRTDVILDAHRRISQDVTDDASMAEMAGHRVVLFDGHPENIKITTPDDLLLAGLIAARRAGEPGSVVGGGPSTLTRTLSLPGRGEVDLAAGGLRAGTGFDGHRLAPPGPLRLGGVDVPFEMHLAGHSDGDVLLHAVASAFLGAAGQGDLGRHFPSSDPSLKGLDGRVLLARVLAMLRTRGWLPEYVDATIIAQRPKLAAYLGQMAAAIAGAAGLPGDRVNVKVTSTDGVGAIGAGEGIAAQAIVTARKAP